MSWRRVALLVAALIFAALLLWPVSFDMTVTMPSPVPAEAARNGLVLAGVVVTLVAGVFFIVRHRPKR
jgi:hypothetical protein